MHPLRPRPSLVTAMALMAALAVGSAAQAAPQSNDASRASAISLAPSMEAGALAVLVAEAGSELVVTALRPVGQGVELVLTASATGASAALTLGAESLRASGIVVGTVLTVTAASAGLLIMAGAEVIAFVPNEIAASLAHHRRL